MWYNSSIKKWRCPMAYIGYDEKSKERTMKYMAENRDKLTLNLPKGDKDRYKAFAESQGKSLTALIVELIEKEMSKGD